MTFATIHIFLNDCMFHFFRGFEGMRAEELTVRRRRAGGGIQSDGDVVFDLLHQRFVLL